MDDENFVVGEEVYLLRGEGEITRIPGKVIDIKSLGIYLEVEVEVENPPEIIRLCGPTSRYKVDPSSLEKRTPKSLKIVATKIKARDLKPGDLFSTAGPEYWEQERKVKFSIGEKVYIRTEMPSSLAEDSEEYVYLITIER